MRPGFGATLHAYSLAEVLKGNITQRSTGFAQGVVPDSVASVAVRDLTGHEIAQPATNNFWDARLPTSFAMSRLTVAWRSSTGAIINSYSLPGS
jgi:hypothetical protein